VTSHDDLDQVIARYYAALREFSRGNPQPIKAVFSHGQDVSLANPFGPPVRGWSHVTERLDYASSRFRDGDFTVAERVAEHVGSDIACIHEIEQWHAKVGDSDDVAPFGLRVTSVFRHEEGTWKLVLRHADPILTSDPRGPLRESRE
jgi:ketosteroid isomerase-like protein